MTEQPNPSSGDLQPAVLVTWPDYDESYPAGRATFERAGVSVRYEPKLGNRSPDELTALLDGVQAAIVSTDPFTAEVLAARSGLRVIARVGVGVDSIDVSAATEFGIVVTTTVGANEATVADHTLALMLAGLRDVIGHDRRVREGLWLRTGEHLPAQLTGSTVLLVGYGRIGRLVAARLHGFDVEVLVCDPAANPAPDIEIVALHDGLRRADVVSLHLPLTPTTRGLVGREELSVMKRGSMLVNTSRGGLVDQPELFERVRSGHLRAAALDVFAQEPPNSADWADTAGLVASPHIGGLSKVSLAAMLASATESVIDVLSGRSSARAINLPS